MGCQEFLAWGCVFSGFLCRLDTQGKQFSQNQVLDDVFSVFDQIADGKRIFHFIPDFTQ
jgi:hypothetical protein